MSQSYQPEQEIRFAVVLYGGISLAIYMNGIAQELLRMVRASADLDRTKLTGTERLYRRLAASIGADGSYSETGSDRVRSRFVIDIISGTSAGGINGVALAKALAGSNPDLAGLEQVWLDEADLGRLLNDTRDAARGRRSQGDRRTESLLCGDHMYGLVLGVLRDMNAGAQPDAPPLTEKLDLFVTATDLAGLPAPIQLTGQKINERIHKTVFHFEYEPNAKDSTNEFAPGYDCMLAFAARCTSSFPVAFEPMRFNRIAPHLGKGADPATLGEAASRYEKFFPACRRHGDQAFVDRAFADGGYLDNRPFSHAIGLIPFRATEYPARRRLLFVDPFPEVEPARGAAAAGGPPEITFLQNAAMAAMTLPRHEVIRDDIWSIHDYNRRLDRLAALQRRSREDRRTLGAASRPSPAGFHKADLAEMVTQHGYGESYPLYHHLRVYDTTDCLARIFTRVTGLEIESDEYTYIRQLVRAWREANYQPYRQTGKLTENAFLDCYDSDYRLRRLNHLRSTVDDLLRDEAEPALSHRPQLTQLRGSVERQIGRLRDELRRLASRLRSPLLEEDSLGALRRALQEDKAAAAARYAGVMDEIDRDARFQRARSLYSDGSIRPHVDQLMTRIAELLAVPFAENRAEMDRLLPAQTSLPLPLAQARDTFRGFHWHDVLSLPFLDGSGVREHAEVQTFRISPAESSLDPSPDKLAGIALHAFGGFLDKEWRAHDILWGRLDGAERIISALLPEPGQAPLRERFTREAHDIILTEAFAAEGEMPNPRATEWLLHEFKKRQIKVPPAKRGDSPVPPAEPGGSPLPPDFAGLAAIKSAEDCRRFFKRTYKKPPGPGPEAVAGLASRAARIMGRMIDDLPDPPAAVSVFQRRAASVCRSAGVLLASLLYFALPQSFGQKLATHALALVALAGLLVILVGFLVAQPVLHVGLLIFLAALVLWLVLRGFGGWLRGERLTPSGLKPAAATLLFALAALGLWKAWELGVASPVLAG